MCLRNKNAHDNGQFQIWPRLKDKYREGSQKILSQQMHMCNIQDLYGHALAQEPLPRGS